MTCGEQSCWLALPALYKSGSIVLLATAVSSSTVASACDLLRKVILAIQIRIGRLRAEVIIGPDHDTRTPPPKVRSPQPRPPR